MLEKHHRKEAEHALTYVTYILRAVIVTSFGRGDEAHADMYARKLGTLQSNEVILLFSKTYQQFRLMWKPMKFTDGLNTMGIIKNGVRGVNVTQNFRARGGATWSPLTVKEFLLRFGIKLEGIELVARHFAWEDNEGRN